MNSLILFVLLLFPQQDFSKASADYARVEAKPTEVQRMYETRVATTHKRVTQLEASVEKNKVALDELDAMEVERYVALRTHFQGKELENRLIEITRIIEVRRKGLRETITMEKVDLADANRRLRELEMELRLARIQVGLTQTRSKKQGNELSLRLAEKSRAFLLKRALLVTSFDYQTMPLSWVTRKSE